jgi:hypothetical protein
MKQEQMVGARLPSRLVRELELIEEVEQSDRSTTVRWLLARAVHERKFEYYAPVPEKCRRNTTSKIFGATGSASPSSFMGA